MTDDKPDTSALDAAAEILGYHGCSSGDCPHEKQSECFAALVEAGYDAGHARALKEMGAKLESAEEGERFYRREWESACERVDYAQEQLAAALAKLKEFDEYYTFQNLERVEHQLAACELRAAEYEKALELCKDDDYLRSNMIKQVLAKHRRGGGA